ncbi:MAG: hypothetical protein JJE55_07020 [Flavobacteriaceae bacterium]|nr:hypothetical protein [Flavobacteriaceae bacterium]
MYNPIKLEINSDVLTTLCAYIDFDVPQRQEKTTRSYISLLRHVALKLSKKEISNRGSEKPIKIKLEYFEAFCLEKTLYALLYVNKDRDMQNIFDQLNQKTA